MVERLDPTRRSAEAAEFAKDEERVRALAGASAENWEEHAAPA